jgi:hypothetical protein
VQGLFTGERVWAWLCVTWSLAGCVWVFELEAHCLEGRVVHRTVGSRYKSVGEEGSRGGCQGHALGEVRCVGLCTGSGAMVH